jgi:hypothetical protein
MSGGVWDFVMRGPDGTDYQEWITWPEIVRPERIALLHGEYRGDQQTLSNLAAYVTGIARKEVED